MQILQTLKTEFEQFLNLQIPEREPQNLYAPLKYVLSNGGKRIRPLLSLLSAKSFKTDYQKALPAAAAIETFHNFTLIHDDIMDKAFIRRGKPTVHMKWNENLAILSGDTMLVWAYKMLEHYDGEAYKKLSSLLNQTAIEVCEGQQMDMDFENRTLVSLDEYLEMIRLKTAVLLGTALEFGAIIANTSKQNRNNINQFGVFIGMAFQIQDDYLDVYAEVEKFGKQNGGDILDRKKTFLYINALNTANETDKETLLNLFADNQISDNKLLLKTIEIFNKYKVPDYTKKQIEAYTNKAMNYLEKIDFSEKEKTFWKQFAFQLMHREK